MGQEFGSAKERANLSTFFFVKEKNIGGESSFMKTELVVRNCPVEFRFVCPKTWERLTPTDSIDVRHCDQCQQQVYYCVTDEETIAHARAGHCIARKVPDCSELANVLVIGQADEIPKPTLKQEEVEKAMSRESGILDAIRNAHRSTRACPECL